MSRLSQDTLRMVEETLERLAAVREDLDGEAEDVLQGYLSDEIERSAKKVKAEQQGLFLEVVRGRLPSILDAADAGGSSQAQSEASEPEAAGPSPADRRLEVPERPEMPTREDRLEVPERPKMPARGERLEVPERPVMPKRPDRAAESDLEPKRAHVPSKQEAPEPVEAGPSAAGGSAMGVVPDAALAAALGLKPGEPIDSARAVELLGVLVEMTRGMDKALWSTWRVLAPRSSIKGSGEVVRTAGAYARGEEVDLESVEKQAERLRQLAGALLSSIGQTGRQFAQRHAEKFDPVEIESWSAREKKMTESVASVSWRRYKEMFGTSDEATIEREIMQQLAEHSERLLAGLGRSRARE